jgi:hypothetical protein
MAWMVQVVVHQLVSAVLGRDIAFENTSRHRWLDRWHAQLRCLVNYVACLTSYGRMKTSTVSQSAKIKSSLYRVWPRSHSHCCMTPISTEPLVCRTIALPWGSDNTAPSANEMNASHIVTAGMRRRVLNERIGYP